MSRPTVVTLRGLGLGDLLTAVPALRALDRHFPDHRRLLACPRALEPLIRLADVRMEVVDTRGPDGVIRVPRRPEVAVNLHGRGPESHLALLVTAPVRLIAFAQRGVPTGAPRWRPDEHEMWRWCRLLTENGIPADPWNHLIDRARVAEDEAVKGATLIHPGAKDVARRWPLERWRSIVEAEHRAGRDVVITGNELERPDALALARAAGVGAECVRAGLTQVDELAELVASVDMVVCGDTGVAHLATALATPLVTLFGPTSPHHWGPPPAPWRRVLWAGRTGDPHADRPDPGLLEIQPESVLEAMDSVRMLRVAWRPCGPRPRPNETTAALPRAPL